jgi:hypothetical protein
MDVFEELAAQAEARWQAAGGEDERFADVAAEVLVEARLPERLQPLEGLRRALTPALQQQTEENEYGEPALTMARRERFRVELIYWNDGAARVHQHVAWGAFSVVCGERLHVQYRMERPEPRPGGLLLGQLEVEQLERLGPGDTRRIYPGFALIHALFFLGRPCVTVSLRSLPRPGEPYWVYYNRRLAFEARLPRLDFLRRRKAWELLSRLEPRGRIESARRLLESLDLLATNLFLDELEASLPPPAYEALLAGCQQRHGGLLSSLRTASAEEAERSPLEALLATHDTDDQRRALGLMWSAASGAMPEQLRRLVAAWLPGQAFEALVGGWLDALAPGTDETGQVVRELQRRFRARLAGTRVA